MALDHYADADTRAAAVAAEAIPESDGGFDASRLLEAAGRLAPSTGYPLVHGSGLETNPGLLAALSRDREVIGNSPATHRLCQEPRRFFALLRECGLPYPEIRFKNPTNPASWLIKSGCSAGGKRVRFCAHNQAGPDEYYQQRLEGPALSVLFLADGRRAALIGFNTLWTAALTGQPYLFMGAINRTHLHDRQRHSLQDRISRLVAASGLVGLNSLDFMTGADRGIRVLEINARPSATLALYDDDVPGGLLAAHIRACRGELPPVLPSARCRAFRAVLAPCGFSVPPGMNWPVWCADRPVSGVVIGPDQPLCTVKAEGESARDVMALIRQRTAAIRRLCGPSDCPPHR